MTLAEHLKTHGYRTFAGVNQRNPYSAHERYGFARGFDEHEPGAEYNQHMNWTREFIRGSRSGLRELYDLEADPGEGRNLLAVSPDDSGDTAGYLEASLDRWVEQAIAARPAPES